MSGLDEFRDEFRVLLELRERHDETKRAFEKAKREYREKEAELFAALQESGIRGRHTFDFGEGLGVAKFQRRSTTYGQILNKEEAIKALKEAGLDHIINSETVREGRLNEFVRKRIETKKELPEGVGYYTRDGISISRRG